LEAEETKKRNPDEKIKNALGNKKSASPTHTPALPLTCKAAQGTIKFGSKDRERF